ncbi:unnamed protein product [Rotaria sp. Silwood2]|nr:unnamed protein product [Rotaria sp. Silwood2]
MLIVLLVLCIQLSIQTDVEYKHLGRPCHINHCDNEHVCIRRKDVAFRYRCIPKSYFKQHPDKITEWNLNPSLIDELVDATKCQSCLSEPLNYVCGTDGRVYRSPCFVKYFNCLLDTDIQIACNKECPCNDTSRKQIFLIKDFKNIHVIGLDEENSEAMDFNVMENVISDPLADDSSDDPRGH